jgi:hypothetical protein
MTEAYAPVPPYGDIEQHLPPLPLPDPAPHNWNLAQVTPAGTVQVQSAPSDINRPVVPSAPHTLNPADQSDPIGIHSQREVCAGFANKLGSMHLTQQKYSSLNKFKASLSVEVSTHFVDIQEFFSSI